VSVELRIDGELHACESITVRDYGEPPFPGEIEFEPRTRYVYLDGLPVAPSSRIEVSRWGAQFVHTQPEGDTPPL
jgi:hypothetical protein